jgi:Asp-tRNA(Asn)/Glu-tRNA(Gln) amidotransferase A subunit family amidase
LDAGAERSRFHFGSRDLAALVARRAISPVEIVKLTLGRIENNRASLNAFG